tara:strand:+ start:42 stop:416 length:375 start_codon:yes stop_codon:yes gene_type:complete
MIRTYALVMVIFSILAFQPIEAGCGSCAADKRAVKGAFIKDIPRSGVVNGKALASCGMCNFETGERSCNLAVMIGSDVIKVANVGIDEHMDSHSKDGFCNVVRVVSVKGKVKNNKLYADAFTVQ